MPSPARLMWLALPVTLGMAACRKGDAVEGEAGPRPAPSARPGVCAGGGRAPKEGPAAALLAREAAGYCMDPNGDIRSYGDGARATLDDACTELVTGECELYKAFGLAQVVTLRYVDGAGSPGAVSVILSRFASREAAFAFFTKRVVGDGDPSGTRFAALDAGAASVIAGSTAHVVRGEHVAELSYTNEAESPETMRASGARVLPPLARALGERLPGELGQLPAVARLPQEERLPLGVSYVVGDVLGISGLGPGATGYYRRGEQRYRVLSLKRRDEPAAGDVLETLRKVEGAAKLKDLGRPAVAFGLTSGDGSPRTEWVVAQAGADVLGVGDEELVLGVSEGRGAGAPSKADEERRKLSRTEKVTLLRRLVAQGAKSR